MLTALEKLTDAIDALTRPRVHHEPFSIIQGATTVTRQHKTDVTPLVEQLAACVEPSSSIAPGHRAPASTPSARIEAIDALLTIVKESNTWVEQLNAPQRAQLVDSLRGILGAATRLAPDDPLLDRLARNARRWVTLAAVTTGWELKAFSPNKNTCPLCAAKGTLRIRVGEGRSPYSFSQTSGRYAEAVCVACMETWDWNTIGLLAEHIRLENADKPYSEAAS